MIAMAQISAGILLYRFRNKKLEVLLVHPGGPFWFNKDAGAWSIPKGLCHESEPLMEAAKREFKEETGFYVDGDFIELGSLKQPSRKIVNAWALHKDIDVGQIVSNEFEMEWPKGSGHIDRFPEIDRGEWFSIEAAKQKILTGQSRFLDILLEKIDYQP